MNFENSAKILEKSTKGEYKEYLSLASVISALAVVFLHVNSCFWEFSATERYWRTANIIECTFYFAVPVFFMISGANLLDFFERYGLKAYFCKRIRKTVIPYLFWSIFGLLYQMYILKSIHPADVTSKFVIKGLLDGNLVRIYWYFPALFAVYLSLPLFAAVSGEHRREVFRYLVLAGFLLNSLIPFLIRILQMDYSFPYSVTAAGGYLIFLPLGWLLSHTEFSLAKRICIYILGGAGLLTHIFGTMETSIAAGQIVDTYKGYFNVPCLLYSTGVFLLIRYGFSKLLKFRLFKELTRVLAGDTFGIYLIHIYILWLVQIPFNIHSIVYRLLMPWIIFLAGAICVRLIRMIPGAKAILP